MPRNPGSAFAAEDTCLIVDCLALWLSNLLFAGAAGLPLALK